MHQNTECHYDKKTAIGYDVQIFNAHSKTDLVYCTSKINKYPIGCGAQLAWKCYSCPPFDRLK